MAVISQVLYLEKGKCDACGREGRAVELDLGPAGVLTLCASCLREMLRKLEMLESGALPCLG